MPERMLTAGTRVWWDWPSLASSWDRPPTTALSHPDHLSRNRRRAPELEVSNLWWRGCRLGRRDAEWDGRQSACATARHVAADRFSSGRRSHGRMVAHGIFGTEHLKCRHLEEPPVRELALHDRAVGQGRLSPTVCLPYVVHLARVARDLLKRRTRVELCASDRRICWHSLLSLSFSMRTPRIHVSRW